MPHYQSQQAARPQRRRVIWLVSSLVSVIALACLTCGLIAVTIVVGTRLGITSQLTASVFTSNSPQSYGSRAVVDRPSGTTEVTTVQGTSLPLLTPTPFPSPTATPTPPGSTPVAVQPANGWSFEGVRIQPDPGLGGLVVYGEAVNSAGSPQRILGLQGTYFDASGQPITPKDISDYWPIETVLNGERMPFELTLIGPTTIERVDLQVVTESSSELPRTDFELSNIEGSEQETDYCVTGQARNVGQPLTEYLMVVAVLYDGDDRVINWGIGYEPAANVPVGDKTVVVSACAERFNRIVARYELRAWGQ